MENNQPYLTGIGRILVRPVGSYAYVHKAWQYIFGSAAVEDMLTAGITYEQIQQAFEDDFIKDTSSSKWEHRGTKYSDMRGLTIKGLKALYKTYSDWYANENSATPFSIQIMNVIRRRVGC